MSGYHSSGRERGALIPPMFGHDKILTPRPQTSTVYLPSILLIPLGGDRRWRNHGGAWGAACRGHPQGGEQSNWFRDWRSDQAAARLHQGSGEDEDDAGVCGGLESVEALLEDAERRSITDRPTCLWLKRLKVAMYAVSNMIDEFEDETQSIANPSKQKFLVRNYVAVKTPFLKIGHKITLTNKMKMMRVELDEIIGQHKKFNLLASTNATKLKVPDERETSSKMYEKIFGRAEERDTILASLSKSMAKEITILPIYGIGGLGKTTFAQMVYGSSQFKDYSRAWVYVSQAFDMKKIGNSIISQLSEKESHYTEMQMIDNSLSKLFADKKILIVLDDLWEEKKFDLDKLKGMLNVGNGSNVIVIVTTRSESIAMEVSTIQPHKLAPLSNDLCWSIIKHKSAFKSRDDKNELKQIGKDIASKCGGVALAAQSLGYVLQSMTSRQWKLMRGSDIWSTFDSKDMSFTPVLASLRLSYSAMPAYLKLCFASMFPKGYKIVKNDLIQQWLALAFIEPTDVYSSWELGEIYIRNLLGLSFLRNSDSKLDAGVHLEDATLFTMHDLVHDLATSVVVDEILVPDKQGNTAGSCGRYALLNDCSKPLESSKIRALRFMDCGGTELDGAAFSSAKFLRILDLSECFIYKLPDSIGLLKQLRYLNAPRIQDTMIPDSITRLSKLTYLNLHGSSISALPESIGDIEGLLYIDLSGCSWIRKMPESLVQLTKLVHLNLSNCSRVGDVSVFLNNLKELQYLNLSYCTNIGELPIALGGLSKLKYLNLSFSSYLEFPQEAVDGQLSLYYLDFLFDSNLGFPEAQGLGSLANLKFPQEAEVLGALTNLEYLNLSCECSLIKKLPEALGNFVNLKYLNLSGFQNLRGLPGLLANLQKLVHLDLSNCPMVNDVPESLGGLTKLEYLNLSIPRQDILMIEIEQGKQRKGLPGVICNLTNLCYLNLSSCMDFIFDSSSSKSQVDSFMYGISMLSNLEHLDLSSNKHIISIPESLCTLRKLHTLDLSHCRHLSMIPESIGTIDSLKFLYLTGCVVLSYSQPPQLIRSAISFPHFAVHPSYSECSSSLLLLQHTNPDELEITRLENVRSPEEAQMIELVKNHRLEELKLQWTSDSERFVDDKMLLDKLVPQGTLEKLEIRGYRSGSFPAWLMDITHYLPNLVTLKMCGLPKCHSLPPVEQLPNIKHVSLIDMASLEEWNTSYSSGEGHVMRRLEIRDCPKLRIKPLPPRTEWFEISRSDSVLSSSGEYTGASITSFYPVDTTLFVCQCKLPIIQWRLLQHLPGISSLDITGCSDLAGSGEIVQHLSSLRSLVLRDQQELPIWLGELTSLQDLVISRCSGLKELHDNMRLLTKLQLLELTRCSSITALPHWLGELTSLEKLEIVDCEVIRSLPEGIQQLTNLQELKISGCPALKKWCNLEKEKMKTTLNQERACVLPTSLEKLEMDGCVVIGSSLEARKQLELKRQCELEEMMANLAHRKEKLIRERFHLDQRH